MRRLWIMLLVGLLAAAAAVPTAAAAKGKPAPPAPALYRVTMAMEGAEGLATTCGTLIMRSDPTAYVADGTGGTSVPRMELAALAPWSRKYPAAATGTEFSGCHGGPVPGSPNPWNGLLYIAKDAEGKPTDLIWHFDYYNLSEKVGKRTVETVREHFTLGTDGFTVSDLDGDGIGEVDAVFGVSYYLKDPTVSPGYTLLATRTLRFEITITPYQP